MSIPSEYKGRYQLKYRGNQCLNCNHPLDLSDKYCPHCSQMNSTKKITFKDLIIEFFGSIISYDSRFRKTMSSLLFKPGKITREYISGKRMTYANPFRFFLSAAIIYAFVFGFTRDFSDLDLAMEDQNFINIVNSNDSRERDSIFAEKDEKPLKEASTLLASNLKKRDFITLKNPKKTFDSINNMPSSLNRFIYKAGLFERGINNKYFFTYQKALDTLQIDSSFENKLSFNVAHSIVRIERQPGTFVNTLISRVPFMIFFFLPVFAVFIWLLYLRRNFTYMDHLVFSFHTQTTFIILITIAFIIDNIAELSAISIALILFLLYLYKAMRNFYQQGRFKTIVKFTILNSFFFILAVIAITILFLASAITY
ncbi:DUF3667 domain-containing protein [Zhouia amylolytica]|nr:DUF3667 domain-containing protein [Zhouia amylolytica]